MANKNNNNSINQDLDTNTRRQINRSSEDWDHIANQLKHSKCKTIEQFYMDLDIPEQTYFDQLKVNPKLKEAHIYRKTKIGLEKEEKCEKKLLTINTVLAKQLAQYLTRWKDHYQWESDLKRNEQPTPSVINFYADPLKKSEDE